MRSPHIPRYLIILILALISVIFLTGMLRAFATVHAATATLATATVYSANETDTDLEPTPATMPITVSADTTGIIALAILIVVIVLVGTLWGGRGSPKKKTPPG
jgi:hypothetical protein